MDIINSILQHIAYSIESKEYLWIDTEKIVVTGNCNTPSQWYELFITANAFLNKKGGTIIIGITDDEDNNRFIFEDFDINAEEKLKSIATTYTDAAGNAQHLQDRFRFTLLPFMGGNVMVLHVDPIAEGEDYKYYMGNVWQRTLTGNQRILGSSMNPYTANNSVQQTENISKAAEELPAGNIPTTTIQEVAPVIQKIYSAELITLFGADYIALEPDCKELLSIIYEKNFDPTPSYPTIAEICSKLWVLRGLTGTPNGLKIYEQDVKKIIQQMEKRQFILKRNGKPEYKINPEYQIVKNLFN